MLDAPEPPDFDSMSRAELLAWLADMTRPKASAPNQDSDEVALDALDMGWDDLNLSPPADDDTPTDLYISEASVDLPPDAIDWLQELAAAQAPEELPDITDYRAPEPPGSLSDFLNANAEDDALAWLDNLSAQISRAPKTDRHASDPPQNYGADFNEDFEDDESLDDLEDESLYSPRANRRIPLAAAQPVPSAQPPPKTDRLIQAFQRQNDGSDLEAWYAARLQAINGEHSQPAEPATEPESATATETESAPTAEPESAPPPAPSRLPPPGLAAAINSARAKVASDNLDAALDDYETLLRTPAGLDWVVTDMRALIDGQHGENPSLHRVLGDALMRLDRLDEALSAYRHALSLL